MSLDGRLKEGLDRAALGAAPDVRRELATVRREARRGVNRRRVVSSMLAAAFLLIAAVFLPRLIDRASTPPSQPATPGNPDLESPLVGSWTQEQSCEDFVRALTEHGLSHYVPTHLVNAGYREGPKSAVAAAADPCEGAGPPVMRTWTFDGTRLRGFLDGVKVDLAFPELIDEHTIRVSHINLGFSVDGDTLRFIVPAPPASCTGPDCLSQHAWAVGAFGLGPWTRE